LRIAVIGAGAIGCLFGARLHLAGQSVLLIHHKKNVAASIAKNGVRIREPSGRVVRANIKTRTRLSRNDKPDLILVTVKAYDTENVALSLRATKLQNVPVLSLQNGLGNVETLGLHLGRDSIIGGTTSEGALTNGPGRVNHTGFGMTWLGEMKGGLSKRCQAIGKAFRAAGFKTVITSNIKGVLWTKAIVNSAINPVTAIMHVRNGDLGNPELRDIALRVIDEGTAVARANGVLLEPSTRALFARILASTARNKSSMLQDIEVGRKTEIRELNGSISILGRLRGVSTPYNELLTGLVLFLERPKG
jgi:2-dehydropantoate 2-reductase